MWQISLCVTTFVTKTVALAAGNHVSKKSLNVGQVLVLMMKAAIFFCPQVVELNTFFLKHILWVPTSHWLNFYRLGIISLIVAPSLR